MPTFATANEKQRLQNKQVGAIAQLVEQRTENPCVPIRELQQCCSLFLWSLTGSKAIKCSLRMLAVKPRVKPSKPYEYYS